ncbi:MAG: RpiB/LacA/LacB family sugar-phosphate isomerase, partial [Tissierellia bacterium]|nr:RpiB/LacA/LacB family sugar-phosphate isomerase [Tissierellia bacterium]
MKIGIGSDHGGFELKEYIRKALSEEGIEVV